MSEEGRPVSVRRRRRWFFRLVVVACGLVLLGGTAFVSVGLLSWQRPEVTVPTVVGLDEGAARAAIAPLGLTVDIARAYQPDVPEGTVIRQDPPGGQKVRIGRRILLHVSSGAPSIPVPDVVGLPLIEAANRLERASLTEVGRGGGFPLEVRAEAADDSRPPGTVLEQDPPAGTTYPLGETVWVVVSSGPRGAGKVLPDLRGTTLEKAEGLLAEIGVEAIETHEVPVEGRRHGLIVGQDPPPGTPVPQAPAVRLEVGVGVAAEAPRRASIIFAVPEGGPPQEIVIVVEDDRGSREVYRGTPKPGDQVSVPVEVVGRAWARLFVGATARDGWTI